MDRTTISPLWLNEKIKFGVQGQVTLMWIIQPGPNQNFWDFMHVLPLSTIFLSDEDQIKGKQVIDWKHYFAVWGQINLVNILICSQIWTHLRFYACAGYLQVWWSLDYK